MERTLAIIKPDAMEKRVAGHIIQAILDAGLELVAARLLHVSPQQAEGFYGVHRAKPFFASLTRFMSSGPCLVMVLQGEGAIGRWRELMGPTDSKKAPAHTVRGRFGTNIEANAVHGSDSHESAAFEIGYFYSTLEIGLTPGGSPVLSGV